MFAFVQISSELPSGFDVAFVSGTGLKTSNVAERVQNLSGVCFFSLSIMFWGKLITLENCALFCQFLTFTQ